MTKVQIYYDEMDVLIQRVNDMAAQMVDRQSLLRNHAEGLMDGGWVGGGANAFYDEFFNLILPSLSKLERALDATAGGFQKASDMLREAENEGRNLFGRGDSVGGGGSSNGGGTSNGGGNSGTATPLTQQEQLLQRFREALASRGFGEANAPTWQGAIGIINNIFGGSTGLAGLKGKGAVVAGVIGIMLQVLETGSLGEGGAHTIEKAFEGGVQGVLEFGLGRAFPPTAIALAINHVVQFGGKLGSGFSSFVYDVNPDPALADSIRNFDTTLQNSNLGNITSTFSSMVVDLGQMGFTGFNSDSPFASALAMSGLPGSSIIAGAIENPALLQELGHNSLNFVGSVVDFGVGAAMLPGAAVDMSADTARVGTHAVGQFFNLSPELNNTISTTVGNTVQFVGDSTLSIVSPVGFVLNQLPDFDAPDVSGWLSSLIPHP